jgi:electron transfer flavoprotein beta subunit
MGAKKKPQATLSTSDLGLDAAAVGEAGSRTEVLGLHAPPPRGESIIIEDESQGAERVLEYLVEAKLI